MSKQRPSKSSPGLAVPDQEKVGLISMTDDWLRRIFKNSYTRAGSRVTLKGWSIKIQYQGRRHTFSLTSKSQTAAAAEAKAIYETILAEGWDAALSSRPRRGEDYSKSGMHYWKERLLRRRYLFAPSGESDQNLAVRIDHGGRGNFFPLGTSDPELAAAQARRIYRMVVEQGWDAVCQHYPRELIVGFEWCSNPVMWTYTTIHTLTSGKVQEIEKPRKKANSRRVLVVESDAGIRRALLWCVNQQAGFSGIACESAKSFTHEVALHEPHIVLVNHNLAGRLGFDLPGQIASIQQSVLALTYSTCADGDQLFVSTPGGSVGYLLKRLKPTRLFDPILDGSGSPEFATADLKERVKPYFKGLLQTHSDHDTSALARLTRREREVLDLLSKGCVDKEIAQTLGISAWTVHDHIKNIFERLHVRTRTEAVVRYLEK